MPYFLLTWNPPKDPGFPLRIQRARLREPAASVQQRWRCGSAAPRAGDCVFMLKQGREPRGIVASGSVLCPTYLEHGVRYIDVELDWLLQNLQADPPLPRDLLLERCPGVCWNTQRSGISIPADEGAKIDELW